jgi:Mn2+/Fe2+ NRAMP family transporter
MTLPRRARLLAPGLIAAASDNDPTTVATMAVAGATTGFMLSLLTLLVLPMLASVQAIASQVGLCGRSGLQRLARRAFGPRWATLLLVSILAVNLVTIGADLEAGAAAIGLMIRLPLAWFVAPYALVLFALVLLGGYDEVRDVLQYAVLAFVAYVAAAILAHPDWRAVLLATVVPHLTLDRATVTAALAILGTTLTSYAYVWQAEEEAEERRPRRQAGLARATAVLGATVAVAVFWFILVATGATLGPRHVHIDTAEQAAQALRPAVGPLAEYIFGVGLLASSFIAVPVLAATGAAVICQQFGWPAGLTLRPRRAPAFYAVVGGMLLVAIAVSLLGVSPIALLFAASIAGGLATPVSLVFLLLIAQDPSIMLGMPVGRGLLAMGWVTTGVVTACGLLYLWMQVRG